MGNNPDIHIKFQCSRQECDNIKADLSGILSGFSLLTNTFEILNTKTVAVYEAETQWDPLKIKLYSRML